MGCHTWSYKKVSALTDDEKQYFVNNELNFLKKWWGFRMTTQEVIDKVTKWFNDEQELYINETRTPEQYALDMIQEFQERLVDIQDNGFEAYIRNCQDNNSTEIKTVNGELYINIGFDDPCRVYGYPEEKFTNVDEFLNWLKTLEPNMVGYYDENTNNFEFIESYTPELEKRVKDYFKKHGEDNLFIKFG